jgi:hypothetical protein
MSLSSKSLDKTPEEDIRPTVCKKISAFSLLISIILFPLTTYNTFVVNQWITWNIDNCGILNYNPYLTDKTMNISRNMYNIIEESTFHISTCGWNDTCPTEVSNINNYCEVQIICQYDCIFNYPISCPGSLGSYEISIIAVWFFWVFNLLYFIAILHKIFGKFKFHLCLSLPDYTLFDLYLSFPDYTLSNLNLELSFLSLLSFVFNFTPNNEYMNYCIMPPGSAIKGSVNVNQAIPIVTFTLIFCKFFCEECLLSICCGVCGDCKRSRQIAKPLIYPDNG